MTRRLMAGAGLVGGGLLLHLLEPVSTLECRRRAPGPADCRIERSFYGAVPYERTRIPAAGALATDDERLGRADPEAVSCTALAVLDGAGDTFAFACMRDAAGIERARRYFAPGSPDHELRLRHSERLVLAVSGAFVAAGVVLALTGWYTSRLRRGQ
jgi:hypothetical protein